MAAAEGNLALVKLLLEVHYANDALVAPDGQLALRLAVENGHREIAAYVPSHRGGGWLRWKTQHAIAVRRARNAWRDVRAMMGLLVWQLPRLC